MGSATAYSVREVENFAAGSLGFKYIASGTVTASDYGDYEFIAIQADVDSQYSATSSVNDNLPDATRSAGSIVLGRFETVTVTSGGVIAYLGVKRG